MSLDRPRRIFRSSRRAPARRPGLRPTVLFGLLVGLGGAGLLTLGASGALSGRFDPGATRLAAAPSQVAVLDGDTLRLGGTVLRLGGVTAPPRGAACGAGPDCGGRAAAALAALVQDHEVFCDVTGQDAAGRASARCQSGGQDLALALLAAGWASAASPNGADAERIARDRHRGQWALLAP